MADPIIGTSIILKTPSLTWRGKEGKLIKWEKRDDLIASTAVVELTNIDMGWGKNASTMRLSLPAKCVILKETNKYLGQTELEALAVAMEQQVAVVEPEDAEEALPSKDNSKNKKRKKQSGGGTSSPPAESS